MNILEEVRKLESGFYLQYVLPDTYGFKYGFERIKLFNTDFLDIIHELKVPDEGIAVRMVCIQKGVITPISFWLANGATNINYYRKQIEVLNLGSLQSNYICDDYIDQENGPCIDAWEAASLNDYNVFSNDLHPDKETPLIDTWIFKLADIDGTVHESFRRNIEDFEYAHRFSADIDFDDPNWIQDLLNSCKFDNKVIRIVYKDKDDNISEVTGTITYKTKRNITVQKGLNGPCYILDIDNILSVFLKDIEPEYDHLLPENQKRTRKL